MENQDDFNELKEALKADIINTIDTCPDINVLIGLGILLTSVIDEYKKAIIKNLTERN